MTTTFKNDASFFTVVMPTRCPIGFWSIYRWVETDDNAKFRFIRDLEIEQERLTIKEIDDIYPEVKTVGIVTNPWARVAYSYEMSINPPYNFPTVEEINKQFSGIDFSTFDTYVDSILTCNSLTNKPHPSLPQLHWLENGNKQVDYLLRAENINEDFKAIQNYFCTDRPLNIENFKFDYRSYYSDKSKAVVDTIFADDIAKFCYEF
jgi:hypothetical protein